MAPVGHLDVTQQHICYFGVWIIGHIDGQSVKKISVLTFPGEYLHSLHVSWHHAYVERKAATISNSLNDIVTNNLRRTTHLLQRDVL